MYCVSVNMKSISSSIYLILFVQQMPRFNEINQHVFFCVCVCVYSIQCLKNIYFWNKPKNVARCLKFLST